MLRKGLNTFLILALSIWATLLLAACPAQAVYLPMLVKDINPGSAGSHPGQLTLVNDTLFFVASDGETGGELWKSGPGGTSMVKDITPGTAGSNIKGLKNVNGTLFFVLTTGQTAHELWKSNGTEAGTVKVAGPFVLLGFSESSGPVLQNIGDTVYFFALGDEGIGLWKSDGTEAGTELLHAEWIISHLGVVSGSKLFFTASYQLDSGEWTPPILGRTDGTVDQTYVFVLAGALLASTSPGCMAVMNNDLFFSGYFTVIGAGYELLKNPVDSFDPQEVQEIHPGDTGSDPQYLTVVNGNLFFTADDGTTGRELWVYMPSPRAGGNAVFRVKDINPGAEGSSPGGLTRFNDELIFAANYLSSRDLYKSNGTEDGTVVLTSGVTPEYLTVSNGKLFFAGTNAYGCELWVSDGTASGTKRALDMKDGAADSNPRDLIDVNGTLYFVAENGAYGRELFKLVEMDRLDIGEWIERELPRIPPEYFKKGDRGLRTALVNIMRQVDFLISQGNLPEAIQKLHNVRRHVDGIGHNNWVTHSDTQGMLTGAINGYIEALEGIR